MVMDENRDLAEFIEWASRKRKEAGNFRPVPKPTTAEPPKERKRPYRTEEMFLTDAQRKALEEDRRLDIA